MNQKEQLASLNRGSSSDRGKKNNWGSLLLLLAFVVGAALVFVLIFGKRLQPRVDVTVTPALLLESDEAVSVDTPIRMGSMLAQASGWIEPDPYPVRVPVKVDGFIEDVLVLEGDTVEHGQLLAVLDATNHALRVDRLEASLEQARQDQAAAEAEKTIAQARHHEAEDRLRRIHTLDPGDVSETEVVAVERAEAEARSTMDARLAEQARQQARVAAIQAELSQAKVDLDRTKIMSPMDGVVLRRFAAPGMKRMAGMDDMESATIVTLYDPERLQVRVDVPLSDAGRMTVGMPAKVVTAALAGQVFTGRITRITGEADIARNTLQVKVAIENPHPAMRPEMLCRVEFFDSASTSAGSTARARHVWLPEAAIESGTDRTASVWVMDPVMETVSKRDIEVGAKRRDGLRIVYNGLRPGERVVVDNRSKLKPGSQVSVIKE